MTTWEYPKYECSGMAWNLPGNLIRLASQLAAGQCTELWVKAGVDNPGLRTVWQQWSDGRCNIFEEYAIKPLAWFYCYPEAGPTQWDTIARALEARNSQRICINVEVEWDGYSRDYVYSWWDGMISTLRSRGHNMPVGFSSVPSWDRDHGGTGSRYIDFPYEAFCEKASFSMPQAYFSNSPDQIKWENPRNTTNNPVIPVLWAPGDAPGVNFFTDDEIVDYAQQIIGECEHFQGFSSWVVDLPTYQFDAMRRSYELIPAELRDWSLEGNNVEKTHADIEREMLARMTLPQIGGVEGRGMVMVNGVEYPFVEFQKYRSIAIGSSIEGFFVDPNNGYSFEALERSGAIRWL